MGNSQMINADSNDVEIQQYLFDLQGYLVIEDVLSSKEVSELNQLVEKQTLREQKEVLAEWDFTEDLKFGVAAGTGPEGSGFLDWGQPFCDLLDHPQIMPVLRLRLSDYFRLDRIFGIKCENGAPMLPLHADYGASAPNTLHPAGEYYHFPNSVIHAGFVVVVWNLSDTVPNYGGFCCIPGSHKSNFRLPQKISNAPNHASCVVIPEVSAGSVLMVTESLTHGTAAWRGKHQRRSLLYKYCQSQVIWSPRRVQPPTNIELTPRQKILFLEPGDPHRFFPSLFDLEDA